MNNTRGHFLVLEGLEGAGKSTALDSIKKFLSPKVNELVITREPGGTQLGESIRNLLKNKSDEPLDNRAELLLFYAARIQLIERVILPALKRGAWVLADRFELSTFAYQGGGRGLDASFMKSLSAFSVQDLRPDLTLFLDITPEEGLARALSRGTLDRIEQESADFFEAVYQRYHQELKHCPRVHMVDASQPLESVQCAIIGFLEQYMVDYA